MTLPQTPFFWVVNVREPNVADRREVAEAVCRFSRTGPWKSWTSAKVKGVNSDLVPVYSPGKEKEKRNGDHLGNVQHGRVEGGSGDGHGVH